MLVPLNETSQFNYYHSHFYFTFSLVIFFLYLCLYLYLYLCLCYLAEFAFILTISDEEKMNANSKNWSIAMHDFMQKSVSSMSIFLSGSKLDSK